MRVILIKRNKVVHCGVKSRFLNEVYKISVCNGRWDADDKTSIGEKEEVTCKRCQKIIARADENGIVTL
jgi:adenine-specific DNA methylase